MGIVTAGQTLFDVADSLGIKLPTSCGRAASCHECVVEVKAGAEALCARTPAEDFLRGNYRLACQARVLDSSIEVEFAALQRRPRILTLSPETISGASGRQGFGVAMDLGTTTIVMDLVDFATGATVYQAAIENPQRFGGSDVMSRISYDGGAHKGELQKSVIHALNRQLEQAYRALGLDRGEVKEVVVVGNSTMRDLFFGLDVQPIGQRPYKSTCEAALGSFAHRLGILTDPKAMIYGAPLIASHVGADALADLIAIHADSHDELFLLVDIGTNTEVILGNRERMLCASCPAGPAFEGGLVKYGMPGCDGAIEKMEFVNGNWLYETIGNAPAEGICGSGLIDLLAELRRHNLMTPKGVFANRARELTIVAERGITFSREDASNLAQAKAANYCGQAILLERMGVDASKIGKLYLAGGFANYINVRNAIDIGFLAAVPEERVVKLGNASLAGARRLLLDREWRESIGELTGRIEHVELETTRDFFEFFVEGCQFKPMKTTLVSA